MCDFQLFYAKDANTLGFRMRNQVTFTVMFYCLRALDWSTIFEQPNEPFEISIADIGVTLNKWQHIIITFDAKAALVYLDVFEKNAKIITFLFRAPKSLCWSCPQ